MMDIKPGHIEQLPKIGSWPAAVHRFDEQSTWAIKAALAAERPLLVRGEPGSGFSLDKKGLLVGGRGIFRVDAVGYRAAGLGRCDGGR
jgi:hypothetical protein